MLSESLTATFSEVAISYVLFILVFCFVFGLVLSWDPEMSHLREYLLLPAVCELGLDCTKGYKMQSALARLTAQIGVPTLQATSDLTSGNIGSSLKCCSFAWCEYQEGKSLVIWEAL